MQREYALSLIDNKELLNAVLDFNSVHESSNKESLSSFYAQYPSFMRDIEETDLVLFKKQQKISYFVAYEENGQVFRKYDFDVEGENILLILDFNLKKGDVATRVGEVVTDVDYVEAYGVRRKRLKIGKYFYWVKGIGCDDDNGLAPRIPIPTFRICSRILKCYEGGELVFTDKDFLTNTTSIGRVADDIIQTEYLYNLQGERVFRPSRGIYIKGSRKVVIR